LDVRLVSAPEGSVWIDVFLKESVEVRIWSWGMVYQGNKENYVMWSFIVSASLSEVPDRMN
jgi:hypothetical protein